MSSSVFSWGKSFFQLQLESRLKAPDKKKPLIGNDNNIINIENTFDIIGLEYIVEIDPKIKKFSSDPIFSCRSCDVMCDSISSIQGHLQKLSHKLNYLVMSICNVLFLLVYVLAEAFSIDKEEETHST